MIEDRGDSKMEITITLGIWHLAVFCAIAFLIFTFIAWRNDWRFYHWICKPIVWVCMPFLAMWCFWRNLIIACPNERFNKVFYDDKKRDSKHIHLFGGVWLWIDSKPLWWGQKIFLIRVSNRPT